MIEHPGKIRERALPDFDVHLTPRELEILQLVANGYSAKEIAGVADLAPRTVERHIDNLKLKFQARNRAHLITLAVGWQVLAVEEDGEVRAVQKTAEKPSSG